MNEEIKMNEEVVNNTAGVEGEKPTVVDTEESVWDKILDVWDVIHTCCYFIPIVTTIAFILQIVFDYSAGSIGEKITVAIAMVGWIAALLTGPWRLIKLIFKWIIKGWTIGFNIFPIIPFCFVTGFIGFALGFAAIGYTVLFAPAIITIYYFFND